jgi:plastocyanin/heme-degrading monooxygenase HmoA
MEYIQTILFQIPASRLEEASAADGLLSELDMHRDFLRTQTGFRDLRITRSINTEGNILVVVETRWSDDGSLVRYETGEPNAAAIVRKHRGVIVGDSLQVLDMEALRTEASWKPLEEATHARERVVLPVVIPAGILAFALLVIYGLSRIYLEIRGDGATALAAGIAIGVLLVSFYLANNPRAPGWQIGGILAVAAITLAGGAIWAVARTDNEGTSAEQPSASASATPSGGATAPAGLAIVMTDNKFDVTTLTAKANEATTVNLSNDGSAIHNVHIAGSDANYTGDFCTANGPDPCSNPTRLGGGATGTITFTLPAGTYAYRCDFHPTEMKGTLTVQ